MLETIDADNPDALEEVRRIQKAEEGLERLLGELREYAAPIHLNREEYSLTSVWRTAWSDVTAARQDSHARLDEAADNAAPVDRKKAAGIP